jgi:hypothetical protein
LTKHYLPAGGARLLFDCLIGTASDCFGLLSAILNKKKIDDQHDEGEIVCKLTFDIASNICPNFWLLS